MPKNPVQPRPKSKALAEYIATVEARVIELEQQLASEIRTRRLVVIDQHGRERIVGRCDEDGTAELAVKTSGGIQVMLAAIEQAMHAGVYLYGDDCREVAAFVAEECEDCDCDAPARLSASVVPAHGSLTFRSSDGEKTLLAFEGVR